ncbi:MAG TPA: alpha-2-macroglobulin family protein, partial [Blastocatellia bacterium]|nr:alpha-2-macroglobulin family protein [Blastocatellia bacterium]
VNIAASLTERSGKTLSTRLLKTVTTNNYGVAKIINLKLGETFLRESEDSDAALNFTATDEKGLAGHRSETLRYVPQASLRIDTKKTIHRAGEPIDVTITSSAPQPSVFLEIIADSHVVESHAAAMHNNQAVIIVPYNNKFEGPVTLAVRAGGGKDEIFGSHTIIYPSNRDLKIEIRLDRTKYQPGTDATADFAIRSASGEPVESVLGVNVLDQAVLERARTDREFGSAGWSSDYVSEIWGSNDTLAGLSRKDLERIEPADPLPDGIDLAAEVLLNANQDWGIGCIARVRYDADLVKTFTKEIRKTIEPVKIVLGRNYFTTGEFPSEPGSFAKILRKGGLDPTTLLDPWGTPYQEKIYAAGDREVLEIRSAGPDKHFETARDLVVARLWWPYFRKYGRAIDSAIQQYHAGTGGYIRDQAVLKSELKHAGLDLDKLRDPWGKPYSFRFRINQDLFAMDVISGGPDRKFDRPGATGLAESDDVRVWTSSIDYFSKSWDRLDSALSAYTKNTGRCPRAPWEVWQAFEESGITPGSLFDPWGHLYSVGLKTAYQYSDRVSFQTVAKYGLEPGEHVEIKPITQEINNIYISSAGEDGVKDTKDDFVAAVFYCILDQQSADGLTPPNKPAQMAYVGGTGAIAGTVTDQAGAVVSRARVTAKRYGIGDEYQSTTNEDGNFLLGNLPPGPYEVKIEAAGFKTYLETDVPVVSERPVEINVVLAVGTASETVTVAVRDDSPTLESATLATSPAIATGTARSALMTPKLREYFPETLLWQPSLETGSDGHAKIKFKLADNITTWRMAVVASTVDGQVGAVDKDIRAFKPFFVELDPPPILTEGDDIALPVVVRNYLDKPQSVNLDFKPEDWLAMASPAHKHLEVAPNEAGQETFEFRAVSSVAGGKQRITAIGSTESDAVEKPVTVHPDGEEIADTYAAVLGDQTKLDADIPRDAIAGSTHLSLKVYPNQLSHVIEGVEAIMERPYGCAEQTISSAYPSLLVLRYYKATSPEDLPPIAEKAKRYVQLAYQRLLNYREQGGAFSYWGHGQPDLALTAYAIQFLNDASHYVTIDEDVATEARKWLEDRQQKDGSWHNGSWYSTPYRGETVTLVSYIARTLASLDIRPKSGGKFDTAESLKKAMAFLSANADYVDDPYVIASFALAALGTGETELARPAIEKLKRLALDEGGSSYWALETNTPFHGWGLTGRIETTGLAVRAIARLREINKQQPAAKLGAGPVDESKLSSASQRDLVNRGLLFLLKSEDQYGVWYSTQATISVLDTLMLMVKTPNDRRSSAGGGRPGEIPRTNLSLRINGRVVETAGMAQGSRLDAPVLVDLSRYASPGKNSVDIQMGSVEESASAQLVSSYYEPWSSNQKSATAPNSNSQLRLKVTYDKTEAHAGDDVTCSVAVERIGFHGYGMMVAEIGLPPGAEVDRESLETAVRGSNWEVGQYDILPDRVLVYVWPKAGGSKFSFRFRPRFAMTAESAPSTLYDYYNPEARVVLRPTLFRVN